MAKSIRGGPIVLMGPASQEKPPGQACVLDIPLRALPSSYLAAGLNYPAQCGAWGQMDRPLGGWTARRQGDRAGGSLNLSSLFSRRNTCTFFIWALRASALGPP